MRRGATEVLTSRCRDANTRDRHSSRLPNRDASCRTHRGGDMRERKTETETEREKGERGRGRGIERERKERDRERRREREKERVVTA